MDKLFNSASVVGGVVGGVFTFMFGGFDLIIKALIALVVLDYLTGFIKGVVTKTLSSETGYKGILKKILIFVVIAVAVIIQQVIAELMPSLGEVIPLREVVMVFYLCNEGISILENAAEFLPIPDKLKNILIQIRNKNSKEASDDKPGN